MELLIRDAHQRDQSWCEVLHASWNANQGSEEVILHPNFMSDLIAKKERRQLSRKAELNIHREERTQVGPSHELSVTSLKKIWFFASQSFLKRTRVVHDASIITFFIACIPHAHLNPFDVQNKHTGFEGGCQISKENTF